MSWTAMTAEAENAGGKFEITPQGTHAAHLVAIIDLGTHDEEKDRNGKTVTAPEHQIFLVWELCDAIETGTNNRHLIGERYNFSANTKAKLRLMLEAWRGKAYAANEVMNVGNSLGKPCLLTIVHKTSKNGREVANIKGVSNIPAGMPVKRPVRELTTRQCTSLDLLPEWLPRCYGEEVREIIHRCHECRPSKDGKPLQVTPAAAPTQVEVIGNTHESAIPF